jgi:hypothetical protein
MEIIDRKTAKALGLKHYGGFTPKGDFAMREMLWAALNLGIALILTAAAILYAPELGAWRIALWLGVLVFLTAGIGLLVLWYRSAKIPTAKMPATNTSASKVQDRLTLERNLIRQLRDYKAEHSHAHVHIHFVSPRRSIAEALGSSFRDAGWQTDMSQRAYETFVFNEFPTGIEIRGNNSNFTRAITQSVIDAGYMDAKPVIRSTTLTPAAENWKQANEGVMIVVGYAADTK